MPWILLAGERSLTHDRGGETGRIGGPPVLRGSLAGVETTDTWQDQRHIDQMLDDHEVWAVVGLSGKPDRTAYRIASLLQQRGKKIVPIHPTAPTVLGEQGYARLADVPFPIDVVDVFRRSAEAGPFADQAVEIAAKGVWFQVGVVDEAAFERTRQAGVPMVMDCCPAIEWSRRGR
jgi:predicted CoA-binding protein